MVSETNAVLSAALAVAAVGFGWVLNEISAAARRHKQDVDALGAAIAELLEIRHRLKARAVGSDKIASILKNVANLDEDIGRAAIGHLLDQFWPELAHDPGLSRRLDAALDKLAGTQPVLAFQLRRLDLMLVMGPRITALAQEDEDSSVLAMRFERNISDKFVQQLEESILKLAGHHGIGTRRAIRQQFARPYNLPEGFEDSVHAFFQELAGQKAE